RSHINTNANYIEKESIEKELNLSEQQLDEFDKQIEKIIEIETERRKLLEKRKNEAFLRKKEYEEKFNYYVSIFSPYVGKEKAEQFVRGFLPRPQTETTLIISDSVGQEGENKAKDVKIIQDFLIDFDYLSPSIDEVNEVS